MKKNIRENISKRIIGTVLLAGAGAMIGILFAKSINTEIKDSETALTLIKYCLASGLLLFGVSQFDGFKLGIKKK